MIQKQTASGVARSIVDGRGWRLVFAAAAPRKGTTFAEQAEDLLVGVKRLVQKNSAPLSLIGLSIFLADFEDRSVYRRMMAEYFGAELPATTYIAQRPCGGKRLAIELWGVERDNEAVEIERADEGLVVVRCPGISLIQLAHHHRVSAGQSVYDGALTAFRAIDRRLSKIGFRFKEVVRTWFYLGKITSVEGGASRYVQLNRARTDFYRERKFAADLLPRDWSGPVFPASSGVGAGGDDLTISCFAFDADRSGVLLFPLENPLQTPAYDYDSQFGEESPKFVRAMTAMMDDRAIIFISGTASIITSDSKHLENVEQQAQQTLDNIAALISAENFRRHGFPGFGATLRDFACVRVYLKRAEDYPRVRAICRERLGELPAIFVLCDLCRPELLVEIEGIVASGQTQ